MPTSINISLIRRPQLLTGFIDYILRPASEDWVLTLHQYIVYSGSCEWLCRVLRSAATPGSARPGRARNGLSGLLVQTRSGPATYINESRYAWLEPF